MYTEANAEIFRLRSAAQGSRVGVHIRGVARERPSEIAPALPTCLADRDVPRFRFRTPVPIPHRRRGRSHAGGRWEAFRVAATAPCQRRPAVGEGQSFPMLATERSLVAVFSFPWVSMRRAAWLLRPVVASTSRRDRPAAGFGGANHAARHFRAHERARSSSRPAAHPRPVAERTAEVAAGSTKILLGS